MLTTDPAVILSEVTLIDFFLQLVQQQQMMAMTGASSGATGMLSADQYRQKLANVQRMQQQQQQPPTQQLQRQQPVSKTRK